MEMMTVEITQMKGIAVSGKDVEFVCSIVHQKYSKHSLFNYYQGELINKTQTNIE